MVEIVVNLHYLKEGNPQGTTIILSHALGCDLSLWDSLVPLLAKDFRILRYDARAHGQSTKPSDPFSIWHMVDDASQFIQAHAKEPVIFAGLSMGGMVGQGLAATYPHLMSHLVIANSAGTYTAAQREVFLQRPNLVLSKGMAAIADGAMERWFSADFRAREAQTVSATKAVLLANQTAAYAYSSQAVAHIDFRADWAKITCPTLLIGSDADVATPMACSEQIFAGLVNATRKQLVNITGVGHLSVLEEPKAFAQAILQFI